MAPSDHVRAKIELAVSGETACPPMGVGHLPKQHLPIMGVAGTEPSGDGLSGQAMALLIPVTLAEGFPEAVEINLMLGGVFLEGGASSNMGMRWSWQNPAKRWSG